MGSESDLRSNYSVSTRDISQQQENNSSKSRILPKPIHCRLPQNGTMSVATNPLLNWDSSATAESYRIQVTTGSNIIYNSSIISITEFQIPNNGLSINTTYQQKVNATNAGGTGPYLIRQFFISQQVQLMYQEILKFLKSLGYITIT